MTQGTSAAPNGTAAIVAAVAIAVLAACQAAEGAATSTPKPQCPTPEEQAYFDSVFRLFRGIVEELEYAFRLADEPYIGSSEASAASDQLIAASEQMNEVKELIPPESLRTFHSDVVTVVDPMQKGAMLMATGFVIQDRELIRDGIFVVSSGGLEPVDRMATMRREWCD